MLHLIRKLIFKCYDVLWQNLKILFVSYKMYICVNFIHINS